MHVETIDQNFQPQTSGIMALQAGPKTGGPAAAGAAGAGGAAGLGAMGAAHADAGVRLGGAASAGAYAAAPADSFAARAGQHVAPPQPMPPLMHSSVDVPGFLLLALAAAGFALRHLGGHRR